jgi:cytoskeletal protein CcmA (bactofilin family)
MASSYTGLGTELMTTGENAGTWGSTTNTNLQIIEQMVGGYVEQAVTTTTTLSVSDGSTGATLSHRIIKFTGTLSANATVTIPLDVQQMYILLNGTAGAYTLTFKYVSGSGSTVAFAATDKGTKIVYATADHATNPNMVDTGISSTGAHDLDGNELILDADADTSITADTDDQIDIKIAGADDFQFTANTFTAQAGSTIAAQALTATTVTASGIVKTDDTTEATSTTDGSLQTDGGLSVAKDAVFGDDVKLLSDSAVLSFGADSDTTLTHTDGTGLTLNSTNKLLFRDTGLYINSSTDGQLDLVADTEIQIAATTIDINGAIAMDGAITGATNITLSGELDAATLDISGNADIDGTMEADAYTLEGSAFIKVEGTNFTDSLIVGHATTGTLSSASSNTIVGIDAGDAITSATGNTILGKGAGTAITSSSSNTLIGVDAGAALTATSSANVAVGMDALKAATNSSTENVAIGWRSLLAATSGDYNTAVGKRSGDSITTGSYNLMLGKDAGQNLVDGSGNIIIGTADTAATDSARTLKIAGYDGSTTTTWITGNSSGHVTFPDHIYVGNNLFLNSDLAAITFGANYEIYLTHVHNEGLTLKHTATGDDTPIKLTLQTGDTDIAVNDVIGAINFQAPDEAAGTDAILVAAGIEAISEGDFSSSNNATKLSFKTGASEVAAEKMSLSSAGVLTVSGAITSSGIVTGTGFTAGSAVLAESELELLDGLTAGTAIASKVVTTDASIDTTGQRNLTISGELDAATLDISGNADIDGTANLDVVDIDGAVQLDATFTSGVDGQGYDTKFFGNTSSAYMLWDTSADDLVFAGAAGIDLAGDIDVDGTANLDVVDIDGAVQLDATFTSGVDGQGYDTKFFGNTSSAYIMWDTSADKLLTAGGALVDIVKDKLMIGGTAVTTTAAELNKLDGAGVTTTELDYSDLATLGTTAASKVFTADANNLTKITGGVYLEEATLSFDATQDWDVRASPVAAVVLTANVTFDAPSNPTTGQYISILCIQDGTGSRTIAWNAVFEFTGGTAPTATTTAAKGDLFTFRYHNSHWVEVGRNLNLTRA